MAITRRQFLQRGAMTAAAVTTPNPLFKALVGTADAAPANPMLVIVQLEGGNDGLNMVVPVDDGGPVPQRSLYTAARPSLGIATTSLAATTLGVDPNGTQLALHPAMTGLKALYDAGNVAVVNGVGYANQSLSHFRSEDIWYTGDPNLSSSGGWFGRYLAADYTPSDLITVDVNETLLPVFVCGGCNVLAVRHISDFTLPQDPAHTDDSAAKKAALEAAYAAEADPAQTTGTHLSIGVSGNVLIDHVDLYAQVGTSGFANLGPLTTSFADRLRQVAAVIRYDVQHPGTPTGARFFHVRQGGFDNHTNQGADTGTHATNLKRVSDGLKAFFDDMQAIGGNALTDRIVVMTFSEFGRRVAENGSPGTAGTDHGAASPLFVIGNQVIGGIYGKLPALNDLSSGNLKYHTDFRRVYATLIDRWLAAPGAHVPLLPGGPFTLLPFLA
jgi:uncharacterized protein (DUF1501 family)